MNFERTIDVKEHFEAAQKLIGFSKREISDQAGMAPGSLSSIILHNNPKMKQLVSLARGLGVSLRYLIDGGDAQKELEENYIFQPLKPPVLRDDWDPAKPNVSARVMIILRQTGQRKCQAARSISANPSWWSPILQRNNPTVRVVEKIAWALKVTPVEVIEPVSLEEYGKVMIPTIPY